MPAKRRSAEEARAGFDPRWVAVGARIKEARQARGLTQRELAEHLSVYEKTISFWEIGQHSPMRRIDDIATVLEVSRTWLLDGGELLANQEQLAVLLEEQVRIGRAVLAELILLRQEITHRPVPDGIPM